MTTVNQILTDAQALLPKLQSYANTEDFKDQSEKAKAAFTNLLQAIDNLDDGRSTTANDVYKLATFTDSKDWRNLVWRGDDARKLKKQTKIFLTELPRTNLEAENFLQYVETSHLAPQIARHLPQAPFKPGEAFPTWENDFAPGFTQAMEKLGSTQSVNNLKEAIRLFAEAKAKVENHSMWAQILACRDVSVETYTDALAHMQGMQPQSGAAIQAFYAALKQNYFYAELPPIYTQWKNKISKQSQIYHPENAELQKTVDGHITNIMRATGTKVDLSAIVTEAKAPVSLRAALYYFNGNLPEATREKIWQKYLQTLTTVGQNTQDELSKIIGIRQQMADNVNLPNYVDYRIREDGRTLNVEQMKMVLAQVKKEIAPLCKTIADEHAASLGKTPENYSPWDAPHFTRMATPKNQTPSTPLAGQTEAQVLQNFQNVFAKMHPSLGQLFERFADSSQMDFLPRPTKAPVIFTASFYRDSSAPNDGYLPYIFQQIILDLADARDVMVNLGHEIGHGMQGFLVLQVNSDAGQHQTQIVIESEKAELTGIVAEELLSRHFAEFIPDTEKQKQAERDYVVRKIRETAFYAANTEFEIWLYEHPTHTVEERQTQYLRIMQEYGLYAPGWNDAEMINMMWLAPIQFLQQPFTNFSYLLSRLDAAQIGAKYDVALAEGNGQAFIAQYVIPTWKKGGDDSYPEILQSYGLNFNADATDEMVQKAKEQFENELIHVP